MISDIGYLVLGLYLAVLRKFWMRWTIAGSENLPRGTGIILTSNHLHWIDIFVIDGSIPAGFKRAWLAKAELVSNPITAWLGKQAHLVPIRRGQIDKEALVAAEEAIRGGRALVIYPEGHRSDTANLQRGRGGAIALALRTGCPIVPMAVWGTETGPKGALQRKPIHVQFGKPYHPRAAPSDSARQATDKGVEEMMLQIAALLPPQYRGVYRDSLSTAQGKAVAE